jgi:hypothetical protein
MKLIVIKKVSVVEEFKVVENKEEKVEEEKTQAASQVTTPSEVITFTIERVYIQ